MSHTSCHTSSVYCDTHNQDIKSGLRTHASAPGHSQFLLLFLAKNQKKTGVAWGQGYAQVWVLECDTKNGRLHNRCLVLYLLGHHPIVVPNWKKWHAFKELYLLKYAVTQYQQLPLPLCYLLELSMPTSGGTNHTSLSQHESPNLVRNFFLLFHNFAPQICNV